MRRFHIAVIGSGPSGIYAAAALTDHEHIHVDVIDRLPTPYGLVRYGVAPDHGKIKSVTSALSKVLDRERVRFLGNVEFGVDISLEELHRYYDALIIANGAAVDRRLGIDGEDLPGSFSATDFVSWYNGHPDSTLDPYALQAETVVVVGVGNVAVDVGRIMAKAGSEMRRTDVPDHVLEALTRSRVTDIVIVGRRGPVQAKFTTKELRELGELANADVIVRPEELELDDASHAALEADPGTRRNLDILREWSQRSPRGLPRRIHLRFLLHPTRISGQSRVTGVTLARGRLDGNGGAIDAGDEFELPAQMILRSIGYRGVPLPDLPFDHDRGIIPNSAGRVIRGGAPTPGEYVAGWIKRGPTGVIGTNRADAGDTVRSLIEDSGALPVPPAANIDGALPLLRERGVRVVDQRGWHAIERFEVEAGRPRDAERVKVPVRERLLAAAFAPDP
jgi:ferredoxin/flavodoxin---NADP+ reductase